MTLDRERLGICRPHQPRDRRLPVSSGPPRRDRCRSKTRVGWAICSSGLFSNINAHRAQGVSAGVGSLACRVKYARTSSCMRTSSARYPPATSGNSSGVAVTRNFVMNRKNKRHFDTAPPMSSSDLHAVMPCGSASIRYATYHRDASTCCAPAITQ